MLLPDKKKLVTKIADAANDLGYQVALLSTGADELEAALAHDFSNAVVQLRRFSQMLAAHVAKESELTNG